MKPAHQPPTIASDAQMITTAQAHKQAVERKIQGLRTHGRLAMHVWEAAQIDGVVALNEILVAASISHIAAIAIPYFSHEKSKGGYRAAHQLTAAVAGLQHLAQGMDLPVMSYQVSRSQVVDAPMQGDLTYMAQGKQELSQMALSALEELKAHHDQKLLDFISQSQRYGGVADWQHGDAMQLKDAVKEVLGIDITQPLAQQKTAVAALKVAAGAKEGAHL
jgi:Tfp pilus assembly major pilin PilA